MQVRAVMEKKLTESLAPLRLVIQDDSAKHARHAHRMSEPGHADSIGETHFRIEIVSAAFEGKSRIERHRMVNAVLADELAGPIHAMQIVTKAPGE